MNSGSLKRIVSRADTGALQRYFGYVKGMVPQIMEETGKNFVASVKDYADQFVPVNDY
jgi:hypothetical protein